MTQHTDADKQSGGSQMTSTEDTVDGDQLASGVLDDVASLVGDSRDSHGDAIENQRHIAAAWTWYLRGQGALVSDAEISAVDVPRMMQLLKLSRAVIGESTLDHDRDVTGYGGIATACQYVDDGSLDEDDLFITDSNGE